MAVGVKKRDNSINVRVMICTLVESQHVLCLPHQAISALVIQVFSNHSLFTNVITTIRHKRQWYCYLMLLTATDNDDKSTKSLVKILG